MVEQPASAAEVGALPGRRRFLGWVIGGIGGLVAAAVGIPAIGALVGSALERQPQLTVRLGKLADYPVGQPKLAQFTLTRTDGWVRTLESRAVWVVRTGDQAVTVFNGRCTHLGCAYSWRTAEPHSEQFVCPCHDGVFALDGTVAGGPPPRPLDTLPVQVDGGTVVITYQDFHLGIPEKTPV
jgi:menaquinol-cytochrome c reductase iron-sulfur subunit